MPPLDRIDSAPDAADSAVDILLRGVRVRYIDVGPLDGPPVVLLHGLGRSRLQWGALASLLSRNHRVIALDLPGFGESDHPSSRRYAYSYESLSETAIDLVAALDLGRTSLVGYCMGAGAALVAAADRPEFVSRLVLVSPPCYPAARPLAERLVLLPFFGPTLGRGLFGGTALRRRGATGAVVDASYAMLRRTADPSTLEARLPRVRCPTLVVWGRDDVVAPWTHGTRLAREIGGARLEILECGHDPVLEKSQSFATLVSAFLDDESSLPRDTRIAQPHAGSVPRLSIDRAR